MSASKFSLYINRLTIILKSCLGGGYGGPDGYGGPYGGPNGGFGPDPYEMGNQGGYGMGSYGGEAMAQI